MRAFRSIIARSTRLKRVGALLPMVFAALLTGCGIAHEKPYDAVDASKLGTRSGGYGLAPGAHSPDANVLDPSGNRVTLSSIRGNRPMALVFYRGGWCPPCNFQVHELSRSSSEFRRRGVRLVMISVDNPKHAVATAKEYGLDFEVLSDPELAAHTAYRVVDQLGGTTNFMLARMGVDLEERSGKQHHDVAVPSVFVIDAAGMIRWAHVDPDYAKRPTAAQILEAVDKAGIAAPE